jgi:hypothetical protein
MELNAIEFKKEPGDSRHSATITKSITDQHRIEPALHRTNTASNELSIDKGL